MNTAVIISSLTPATGNAVTALRFQHILSGCGFCVSLIDAGNPPSPSEITRMCNNAALIIAIHAYRSGRLIPVECTARVILVLGGTDVNEAPRWEEDRSSREAIRHIFLRADQVVAFTSDMATRFCGMCERLSLKSSHGGVPIPLRASPPAPVVIPQSVEGLPLDSGLGYPPVVSLRSELGLASDDLILLLVAGLRDVKSPLLLAPVISAHNATLASITEGGNAALSNLLRINLVLIGPLLDPAFAARVTAAPGCDPSLLRTATAADTAPFDACLAYGSPADRHRSDATSSSDRSDSCGTDQGVSMSHFGGRHGIFYHPPVPRSTLLAWMVQESSCPGGGLGCGRFAIVNSSESEGQSNALLEAMQAGVPVLARMNEGNARLISHGSTGWLWSTPDELVRLVLQLWASARGDDDALTRVAEAAFTAVTVGHSAAAETAAWHSLLRSVLESQADVSTTPAVS
jgi:hypothetical protein